MKDSDYFRTQFFDDDRLENAETTHGDSHSQTREQRLHRVLLTLAIVGLFGPALIAWGSIIQLPAIGIVATASCVVILGLVVVSVTVTTQRALNQLDFVVLALALILLAAWASTELYFYPAYGTDESAFVQYAAQLLLHGHNPYSHNLLPALTQFRVPIQFATYKLNGTLTSTLGYPALSFLLVAPAVLLTHGVQAIIGENVIFLALEMVLMFIFVPRTYRSLAVVVVLGLPFIFDYSIGGDIVTMTIPFMLVLAYRWTDIGRGGQLGRGGVLRAICLGLAVSISQFPWFVAPFVVLGLWRLRSTESTKYIATRTIARFVAIVAITFIIPNGPFIVWNAHSWLSGVLGPLDQHAIPFGQGLIDASVFFGVGGGNLAFYTYTAAFIFLGLLCWFFVFFPRLWRATFILPSAAFLFSTRSLSEYFIMMVAMWFVSVWSPGEGHDVLAISPLRLSWRQGPRNQFWRRDLRRRSLLFTALAIPFILTITGMALALSTPAPLTIKVVSVETNGQLRSIWRLQALVENHSVHTLTPHFATDASGYLTTFWNLTAGPHRLAPGATALYTLIAPNVGSMPGVTQPFVLQAVTAAPETISSSNLYTPEHFDCYISPSYINKIVRSGQLVTLDVDLLSPYGSPIHRAGVPIAMSQVIYAQSDLYPGEAVVNNAPQGQSPVIAKTNVNGVAHFTISDSSNQGGNPIYFQAYVSPPRSFPYGYSEIVSIRWSK